MRGGAKVCTFASKPKYCSWRCQSRAFRGGLKRSTFEKLLEARLAGRSIECVNHGKTFNSAGTFRCLKCSHTWVVARMTGVLAAKNPSGCPTCSMKEAGMQRRHTHKEVVQSITERIDVTVLSKYKGDAKPLSVQCNVCGNVWDAPATHLRRDTGCPECNRSPGGDGLIQIAKGTQKMLGQKTWLYVLKLNATTSKIGITNNPNQRLREFRSKKDFSCLWEFDTRAEAIIAEWVALKNTEHNASNVSIKGGGNSEVRSATADELINECQLVVDMMQSIGLISTLAQTGKVDAFTLKNIEKRLVCA